MNTKPFRAAFRAGLCLCFAGWLIAEPLLAAEVSCGEWNTIRFFATASVADVARCLNAGADSNARDDEGWTPLHNAARFGGWNPEAITALVAAGADPNARDDDGKTPLHGAAALGDNPAAITALVAAGADPNARDDDGETPLHHAATFGGWNPAAITALVAAGADPNAWDDDGETPLHRAAALGDNPAAITALVAAGADPNERDEFGNTPLQEAAADTPFHRFMGKKESPALMAAFTEEAVAAFKEKQRQAAAAARRKQVEERVRAAQVSCDKWNTGEFFRHAGVADLSRCLETKDPNARGDKGRTPLHAAAMFSMEPAVAAALSKAGAELDARDDEGRTPLHLAGVFGKSPVIVSALVDAGADLDALDRKGRTPLQFAEKFSNTPALVHALRKAKDAPVASVKAGSEVSCERWNTASFFKHAGPADLSRCLETEDPNARNENGRTPMHYAAQAHAPTLVTALAAAGSRVNARDERGGWTPLHLAAWFGKSRAVVQTLLDVGADPEAKDDAGRTPWDYLGENPVLEDFVPTLARDSCEDWNTASFFERTSAADVSRCLEAGAKVNARDEKGATPLHLAAQHGKTPAVVTALVAAGARVSARDVSGATPLHAAAAKSTRSAVLQALLDAGADAEAKDETGKTPWDYLKENPALRATDLYQRLAGVSCEDWNTALFFERAGTADVSRCLKAGAEVGVRDEAEATPLHLAASKSEVPAVVQVLLDAGADPAARDMQGKAPWDYAKTNPALKGTEVYWTLNEARFN